MVSNGSNGNGHVPGKIVELLITNIDALTKEIQRIPGILHSDVSNELTQLNNIVSDINKKINTPPRNEELRDSIDKVQRSLEEHQAVTEEQIIRQGITKLQGLMKSLRTIIITVCSVFSAAVILTGFFIDYSNDSLIEKLKEDTSVVEVVPEKLQEELQDLREMVEKHLEDRCEEDENP